MDGQQGQGDPAQQLLLLFNQLNQRLQILENQPQQPAAAPQGLQQQQPPPGPADVHRAVATDFGFTPEEVNTAFRELVDRLRTIPIPSSASVNTTKPRGASQATKGELDSIARIATISRTLLQLYNFSRREEITTEQLGQALLTIGLHLTAILQTRQGDLFVESTFPDAYDTFRALRAGPGGSLAGEELHRLTTAIQLSGHQQQQQQHRPSNRGNFNGHRGNNSHRGGFNNFGSRGGHQGSNFNNYNNYGNQRGGFQQHQQE